MEKEDEIPLVSICCTCYNHEPYIRDALEGFVMQKTTFPFEIIVFDDASTDNSQKIILEYAAKYPDLFRLFLQKENLWQNKGISGTFTISFPNARGKYIAWCEGDDYWTDPQKLQRQVDFLEANEDFSICFHTVKMLQEGELVDDNITRKVPDVTDIYELAKGNYIHTPSVVFRRNEEILKTFATLSDLPVGDYSLLLLNAQYGKIMKLKENMAVYRVGIGCWSSKSNEYRYSIWLDLLDKLTLVLKKDERLVDILNQQYGAFALHLCKIYKNQNNIEKSKQFFTKMCMRSPEKVYEEFFNLNQELLNNRKSKEYRLGKFILKPLSFILNKL